MDWKFHLSKSLASRMLWKEGPATAKSLRSGKSWHVLGTETSLESDLCLMNTLGCQCKIEWGRGGTGLDLYNLVSRNLTLDLTLNEMGASWKVLSQGLKAPCWLLYCFVGEGHQGGQSGSRRLVGTTRHMTHLKFNPVTSYRQWKRPPLAWSLPNKGLEVEGLSRLQDIWEQTSGSSPVDSSSLQTALCKGEGKWKC